MSFDVCVRPSGHVFQVQNRETLLDAGLRDGLNLDHACNNGSCGACAARLLSGELLQVQHHDYRFPPGAQEAGGFLMCCHRPTGPVEIEAHEVGSAAEVPLQHIRSKVQKIERLGHDVIQLHLRTPRTSSLQFLAGQSVALHLDGMAPVVMALAGCPCDGMNLRVHVRRRAGDAFSELVFERLKKGREVVLSGPLGDFTLDEQSRRPLLFLAWETGFATVASLIDHAIQLDEEREMHLYWVSGEEGGHYLANYCRAWQDALDHFHYHGVQLMPRGAGSFSGMRDDILQRHGELAEWECYGVLPAEGLAMVEELVVAGLPRRQLHTMQKHRP